MSGVTQKNKILIVGGSGTLGSSFKKSFEFKNADYPSSKSLDLTNKKSIKKFLKKKYNIIINCMGAGRIRECEKFKDKAIKLNVVSVINLVDEILACEKKFKKKLKLIHISTDVVYKADRGNYKESDKPNPQNFYGFTKMISEQIVSQLKNHLIIRTRFFNKDNFKYREAATDIFSSMLEVNDLVKKIVKINKANFRGTINIGDKRVSDYSKMVIFFPKLKRTSWKKIQKKNDIRISQDSSLNLSLYKNLTKKIN